MTPTHSIGRAVALVLPMLAAGCAGSSGDCPAPCKLEIAHLAVVRGHLAIPLASNGEQAEGFLDTGAAETMLTRAAADRLDARAIHDIDGSAGVVTPAVVSGVNGEANGEVVTISDLRLAGGRLRDAQLFAVPAMHLGDPRIDGLIGDDLLQNWDLDLDVQRGVLYLDKPQHVPIVPPWHHASTIVPFTTTTWNNQIRIPVTVDGHGMEAILDTGAPMTFIDGDTAAAAEVLPTDKAGRASGIPGIHRPTHRHHYDELSIGGLSFGPIDADVATNGGAVPGADMLLGLNALRLTRVYIAWQAHELLIDEGGP